VSDLPVLVFLSGLGGDARLLNPQRTLPWPVRVLDWIEPQRGESLAHYGRRLAERFSPPEGPYFLGGVSMGGMLALEMSRWTRPEAVFLIASCRSGRAVKPVFRFLGRVVGRAPFWADLPPRVSRRLGNLIARRLLPSASQLTEEQRRFLAEIGRDASPRFVKWGCLAVVTWRGVESPPVPVYHIHGEKDRVIPLARVRPDRIVEGGSHLINLTHPDEVNAFVAERVEAHIGGRKGRTV